MHRLRASLSACILSIIGLLLLLMCTAVAQNYVAPSTPVIGSANTVTANPPVPRPTTTPCTVTLFQNFDFDDFNPRPFDYTPPASCPGPWAAVVLEADWSVDAGVQFDRTGNIWIGGANVFFGTTPEPSHNVQRMWHTEENLIDYSPLFTVPQSGTVDLFNLVNDQYTSHIHGSAYIQFYPLAQGQSPPTTADIVLPMSAGPTGGTVTLNSPTDQLAATFNLPTNVERAYLDVFAQGQSGDEFWYTCAPNDVAGELFNCGSTGFRESEVSIDGQPAGVAPIYPWIFTGGIDPFLWRPIPGVHTLNFEPYRVDLTPFAGMLSDGQPHTVAVSVYNADMYFSATASLLLYQDHGGNQVTGSVTTNTVGQPDPVEIESIITNGNFVLGPLSVTSNRGFVVEGFVNTSHGMVDTKVVQSIDFSNGQKYYVKTDGTVYQQVVDQTTSISSATTTTAGSNVTTNNKQYSWPLTLAYSFNENPDMSYEQFTTINQGFNKTELVELNGNPTYSSTYSDAVAPRDTLMVDASGNATTANQSNTETYQYSNSNGACWNETINAAAGVLTSVSGGSCTRNRITAKSR
ncbi:MAG: peptide-N4-asparagine amidase [Candidatus Korobacteraceae bacterium]